MECSDILGDLRRHVHGHTWVTAPTFSELTRAELVSSGLLTVRRVWLKIDEMSIGM